MKATCRQKRILVVDDDRNAILVMSRLLERRGYEYRTCMAANDCMAIVEQWLPDVLLVDLSMPEMSGFDIADELQNNPDLRPAVVVAVSGYDLECFQHRFKEKGFDHDLMKPMSYEKLESILEQTVSVASSESE